jgi:quercetin dioxygenase-like cupin family protein
MSALAESGSGGVSIVRLSADVPLIQSVPGVRVQHLVGQSLMLRVLEVDRASSISIAEPDGEHVVIVVEGQVTLAHDARSWTVDEGAVALVRAGRAFTVSALDGAARCQIMSTPPNVELIRHLLHLEHVDHGFD